MGFDICKVYLSTDGAWTASPTWLDVSGDVRAVTVNRSTSGNQYAGGTASITFKDNDGTYDTSNAISSIYYLADAWLPVKIEINGNTTNTVFRGWTAPQGWARTQTGPQTATTVVSCVDASALIANYTLDIGDQPVEWSPIRIRSVLDEVAVEAGLGSWPFSVANLADSEGTTYVDAFDGTGNAWSHIQLVGRSEGGVAFIDRNGDVTLFGRHTAANRHVATPTTIITDDGNPAHVPLYHSGAAFRSFAEVRRAIVTIPTSDDQLVSTGAVGANEVPNTRTSGGLPIDVNSAQGLADWMVQTRHTNVASAAAVSAKVAPQVTTGTPVDNAAKLDIGSQVRVEAEPAGHSSQQTYDCWVTGVSHTVTDEEWMVSVLLEPDIWWTGGATASNFLRLDHGSYGQLDQELLGY